MRRFHHGLTDSTNERALAAIAEGSARHCDLHVAHGQTAGRGRLGRPWHSAEGLGLYVSLVLEPHSAPPPPALTIAGGLGVLDAVRSLGVAHARLDWPNDLMVDAAKLAGVLVETRGLDPARPQYVLGVGLNVAQRGFPDELTSERGATSLALEGLGVSIPEAETALVDRLQRRIAQIAEDPDRLASDYLTACGFETGPLLAKSGDREVRGELATFDLVEGLTLSTPGGEVAHFALELLRELRRI